MYFNGERYSFKSSFFAIVTFLLMVTLLISLGVWQLKRADEKRQFLQQQRKAFNSVITLSATTADNSPLLRYRQATVEGFYDTAKQFLIDNQIVQGKVGYFVLTPFVLTGTTKAVLVNRGWVAASLDRSQLPNITFTPTATDITGRINNFPSVGLKLQGATIPTARWPAVVQVVESPILAQKLGYDLFSFQLELDPQQPQGYHRDWLETTIMPVEQHIGYALQWFGLAITLTLLFFWQIKLSR
jgi:surfeit locus 1 family protein